jgi:hypothetical protein
LSAGRHEQERLGPLVELAFRIEEQPADLVAGGRPAWFTDQRHGIAPFQPRPEKLKLGGLSNPFKSLEDYQTAAHSLTQAL